MSTILKALRRLEQDRATEAERPLQAAVADPAEAPAPRASGNARWIAAMLAATALGAAAGLLLQRAAREPAPGAPVAQAPRSALPPSDATPARPPSVARTMPPVAAAPARLPASPPPLPAAPVVAESPPAPEAPMAVAAPPPAPKPSWASTPAEPPAAVLGSAPEPAAPMPARIEPPAPSHAAAPAPAPSEPRPGPASEAPRPETPVRVARIEPASRAPHDSLPGLAAPGEEAGAVVAQPVTRGAEDADEGEAIRTIGAPAKRATRTTRVARVAPAGVSVLRTVWHPKPERRTAVLEAPGDPEPREYREGDSIGALVLLRIEPSGVVFERDGTELQEKIRATP